MQNIEKLADCIDTLLTLYVDMTSEKTLESIRTGPHITLISGTLIRCIGNHEFVKRVQAMREAQARREAN